MFRTILMFEGPDDVVVRRLRQTDGASPLNYEIRRSEIDDALGGLEDTGSLMLLDQYLRSLEEEEEKEEG